jgi:DNA-binding CsgD family transcriptional regulator
VSMVDGQLAPLYARHAFALDTKDADGLEGCGRDFEALGALLSATDAFAHAAVQHEADGNRSNAVVAATAAYRIAALCGGVTTPALVAVPDPSPLTVREREIAGLIAARLSNSEIADRLVLSVRTVESHIYRACAKLDVTDRDQLAANVGQSTAN